MTHKEIAIKLALLTNGKTITFDHKSYDDANDIPHLMVDGIRFNVETAKFNEYGKFLEVTGSTNMNPCSLAGMGISFMENEDLTAEMIEEECKEMGMYELFSNIYYETNESHNIGDFEIDFLYDGD
jgi:hypothetical protein